MIRSTLAGLGLTAVAAATTVFMVGLIEPATGIACYRTVSESHAAPVPGTTEGPTRGPVRTTDLATPPPSGRSTRLTTTGSPTTRTTVSTASRTAVETTASTENTSETCVPADELPGQEGS